MIGAQLCQIGIFAAVKCAAPGGIWPPDAARGLAHERCARSTAAAAMPAQTDDQHRCATGIMVWAWICS